MDLPPFRRRHHHHHNSRYVDIFHLPNFTPPPFHKRHLPPLTPPPPRPPPPPPHHLLPPIPPHHIPHNPLPPPPPAHFTLSHPHPRRPRSIEERSQRYEFDRPCSPPPHHPLPPLLPPGGWVELQPPPPPPLARENFHFRSIDNCEDQNPMFKDEFFVDNIRKRYRDNKNDVPVIWDRGFPRDGRKIIDLDFDRKDSERYPKRFQSRSERDFSTDPLRVHESYRVRDGDDRRWDYDVNDRVLLNQESAKGHSLARFRGRLGRGGSVQEFIRSPKKQVQKKSALLRIQLGKSSNRNRGVHEHHHFPKELSSSSSRGKEKESFVPSQRKMEEEREREMEKETERSPVELDVSFKSNALVAKAIVSSSSPALESDRNLTPKNRNIRKANSMSGSPLSKLSAISSCKLDFQSDPNKALKGSEEKVAISGGGSANDNNPTYLGDNAADKGSLKAMDFNQNGNSDGSDRTPIHRVRKKRKLNMQIVSESSPQLTKDTIEIINANTCVNSPSASSLLDEDTTISEGNMVSAGSSMEPDIVLPSSSNEVNNSEAEEMLEGIVSKKDGTDIDSSNHFIPNSKTKKSSLNMFSATSCLADDVTTEYMDHAERLLVDKYTDHAFRMGINEDASPADGMVICENAIHADRLGSSDHADNLDKLVHPVLNLETSAINSHNQLTITGTQMVDGVNEQPFQDAVISSDNIPIGGPSKVTVSIEDRDISDLIRPEETRIHEVQGDTYVSKIHDIFSASESDSELCKRTKKVTSCRASFVDAGSKDSFSNHDVVPQDGVLGPLYTEETRFIVSAANADNLNFSSGAAGGTNFLSIDCPGNTAASDIFHGDVIGRKSCKYDPTLSLENGLLASSSIDHSPKTNRKMNTRDVRMGLSAPNTTKMHVDVGSSVGHEEMELLVGDLISAVEVDVSSHTDNIKDGNQSIEGPSEVKDLVKYGLDVVANGSFPDYSKRKIVSPLLPCTSFSEVYGRPQAADKASLVVGASSSGCKGPIQSECLVKPSAIHDNSSVCLSPCLTQTDAPFDISVGEKSFLTDSIGGDPMMDCSKLDCNSPSLPEKGVDHKEDVPIVASTATYQRDTRDMEAAISREIFDAPAMNKTVEDGDNRNENYLLVKDDFTCVPNNSSLCSDGNALSVTSTGEELVDSGQDMPSGVNYTEDLLSNPDSCLLKNSQASTIQLTDEKVRRKDTSLENVESATYPASVLLRTSPKKASLSDNLETNPRTSPSLPLENTEVKQNSNITLGIANLSKNQPTSAVPRVFPGHLALSFNTLKSAIPSAHVTKSRTWRRTGNSSVVVPKPKLQSCPLPQSQVHKTVGNVPSSYIRKGNSLVRKPSPSDSSLGFNASSFSVYRLSPSSEDNLMNQASENKIDAIDPPSLCRTGVKTPERAETSSLFSGESLNCTAINLGESRSLPVANPLGLATTLDPLEEIIKSSAVPECRTGSGNNSDSQSPLDEGNLRKKITYVKRRSYQLVAASDSEDPSIWGVDKTTQASSDSYYKRRKNQLVRASLENHAKEGAFADGNFDSNRPRNRRTNPGSAKTDKASKFSSVWKLRDMQLSGKHNNSARFQKVRPYLFPWKRATYWRNFIYNSRSMPNDSSLSMIGRKLLLSRKRGAIYTRSTRGFSLRISKVLSVGGSSLKWSKSIERNSKKANEEATRAVAAVEKRKKEQTVAVPIVLKNKNHVSRERIFRIGSERYKMDSTRKTLQRITAHEEPSNSVALESGKKIKASYVPRRLLIGNEEYVRIGNGNQLVRDPKKRTRILASEKVRWSLHTARLRLTRKRKYCLFFTRFGKCNKDDGKCPYIHDPSKVVVCTKFLKGSCLNPECKLTHKVIPERMQDCSYFLQGLCSNKSCPYRHVNVNPNSSICESFLKGYCADGNECRKKHTYVCPAFEATGFCPEGSKCKLHHPKRKRGIKRKSLSEQKNIRGRYFDSELFDIAESQTAIIERLPMKGNGNIVCQEEEFEDYISLDVGNEEVEHSIGPSIKRVRMDSPSKAEVIDLDELIKPIRIMNRSLIDCSNDERGNASV